MHLKYCTHSSRILNNIFFIQRDLNSSSWLHNRRFGNLTFHIPFSGKNINAKMKKVLSFLSVLLSCSMHVFDFCGKAIHVSSIYFHGLHCSFSTSSEFWLFGKINIWSKPAFSQSPCNKAVFCKSHLSPSQDVHSIVMEFLELVLEVKWFSTNGNDFSEAFCGIYLLEAPIP